MTPEPSFYRGLVIGLLISFALWAIIIMGARALLS